MENIAIVSLSFHVLSIISYSLQNLVLSYRFDSTSYHPLNLEQYREPLSPKLMSEVSENGKDIQL